MTDRCPDCGCLWSHSTECARRKIAREDRIRRRWDGLADDELMELHCALRSADETLDQGRAGRLLAEITRETERRRYTYDEVEGWRG